jgi:hypothetical protein
VTAHWGVPDPAGVDGTEAEQRRLFREAHVALENRIKLFVALPIEKLDRLAIQRSVDEIGRGGVVAPAAYQNWSSNDVRNRHQPARSAGTRYL